MEVSFSWEPVECEQRLGETLGYMYEVRDYKDRSIAASDRVNETKVTVTDLVPYTRYVFQVKFVNHIGGGPLSDPQNFTTLQGREYF